jgi:hypothetical protein
MTALAEGEVVGHLGKISVGVEALNCGFNFLNLVKG